MSSAPNGLLRHEDLPPYLSRKQPRSVERAASEGRLGPMRPVKLGGQTFYCVEDVQAYEAAQVAARHASAVGGDAS